jgi:hypothetical protein
MTTSLARRRVIDRRLPAADRATLARRMRWASDPLLRSTIGQALPDRQAELLLNWGLRQMARSARSTAGQSDPQARSVIRSDLNLVRKMMRRIEYLMERRAMLDEADQMAQLAVIAAMARQLPQGLGGERAARSSARTPSLTRVARQAARLDAERWLARLIRFTDSSRGCPLR